MQRRAEVGRYPRIAADWRSDVRIKDTGDPTAPEYREWTHKEIWDLITMGGKAADPRIVQVEVRDPKGMAGEEGLGLGAGLGEGAGLDVAGGQAGVW